MATTATSPEPAVPSADDAADLPASALESSGPPARVHYPGFEGLRAMAAIMVVFHHASSLAGPERTADWIRIPAEVADGGVAVFFVLSGFLIYRPFAVANHHGTAVPPTLSFWWRRLIRLVPAYWLALTFFWVVGSYELKGDWWQFYFFGQIYSRTTRVGIFQAWSLCTEVTFYLMVPVWAAAMRRLASSARVGARFDLAACGVLYLSGFAARAVISSVNPTWRGLSFQWLPTNIDLFAAGMAVAVLSVWAADGGRLGEVTARLARYAEPWWIAAIALYAAYAIGVGPPELSKILDPNGAYRGWFWQRRQLVLGLFTLLLMVPCIFGDQRVGPVRAALRLRPIAWLGTISYGIYLWHFDWMKRAVPKATGINGEAGWPGWADLPSGTSAFWYLLAVGLGFSIVTAAISWSLVERPAQRFRSLLDGRFERPPKADQPRRVAP